MIVCIYSKSEMSLEGDEAPCVGYFPIVGHGKSHLWVGASVDAVGLRTTAEFVVLKLHRLLFLTNGEHSFQPTDICIQLLYEESAGVVGCYNKVCPIANIPLTCGIIVHTTENSSSKIARVSFNGRKAIFVGS